MRYVEGVAIWALLLAAACREPLTCPSPGKTCGALCCPAPANGSATCDGAICGIACVGGYHPSAGACTADTTLTSCGAAGADCTVSVPAHAAAVCAGDPPACGFGCASGYHREGAACEDDESLSSCGPLGADCTSGLPANASPTCDGFACDFACNSDFHKTGATCSANTEVTSCGPSGIDCEAVRPAHATASCDGSSCDFACEGGYHAAGDGCTENTSVDSCGPSGDMCPEIVDGHRTCDGFDCAFECNMGFHKTLAGDACTVDTSIESCGQQARDCTTDVPANATSTCSGVACGFDCNSDFHKTGTACTANNTLTSCGPSGADCTSDLTAHATSTCDGTACGFDCNSDFHKTASTCTANTSVTSCGLAGTNCTGLAPANAGGTCDGVSCGFECNANFYWNGSACVSGRPMPDSRAIFCTDGLSESSCPTAGPLFGQDGNYLRNRPTYTTTSETVRDSITGLVWQRNIPPDLFTCDQAAAYCTALTISGGGWRVPTRLEVIGIIDYGRKTPPLIDVDAFTDPINLAEDSVWTSTPSFGTVGQSWPVRFSDGYMSGGGASCGAPLRVRCVQGAPWPAPSFVESGQTIRDTRTGLVWQKGDNQVVCGGAGQCTWANALLYCETSAQDGLTDWRLPSVKELQSIVDEARNPPIDPVFSWTSAYYWSSTPVASTPHRGYTVNFGSGSLGVTAIFDLAGNVGPARCVR